MQFLAAAELIEADLWQQYAELGGVTTGPHNACQNALQNLDSDGSQYISSNTLDEQSHAQFLNAYFSLRGQESVNFDQFRSLPSSKATGAQQIGRLTNLTQLSMDTSRLTLERGYGARATGCVQSEVRWPILNDLSRRPRTCSCLDFYGIY